MSLAGCAAVPDQPAFSVLTNKVNVSGLLPLPNYRLGDRYTYTRGPSEKIVRVDGEKLVWQQRKKREYSAWRSFFLPRSQWRGRETKYAESVNVAPDYMWPLSKDSKGGFRVLRTNSNMDEKVIKSYEKFWQCEVDGAARIRVLAGDFDTRVVRCRRTSMLNDYRQTSIWYYSPELQHYVLKIDKFPGKRDRIKQLTAVEPGLIGELGLYADEVRGHLQASLEKGALKRPQVWRLGRLWVEVVPVATKKTTAGVYCRNYRMRVNTVGYRKNYAGIACRSTTGRWLPPVS